MKKRISLFVLLISTFIFSSVIAQNQGDDIENNPQNYFDQTVTVEGIVNIVAPNAFELSQTQPFNLSPESVLVLPETDNQFGIDINNGMYVRVTGTFNQYDLATMESDLGYDLDDDALNSFDTNDYAITATSVEQVDRLGGQMQLDNTTAIDFENNPQAQLGLETVVEGIVDIVSPNVFELTSTRPYDLSPTSLLVLPDAGGEFSMDINNGQRVRVRGTFQQYDLATMESDLGVDLDDDALADYDTNDYAVVATNVTRVSDSNYLAAASSFNSIVDSPDAYAGQTVTVAGYIGEDVDLESGNFVLHDDDTFSTDRVLVLSEMNAINTANDMLSEDLTVDDRVVVTGTVQSYNITNLEVELGYELDENLYSNYEGLPVIVATSVEHAAEGDLMTDDTMQNQNMMTGPFDPANYQDFPNADVDLDEVIDDTAQYYGQIVNVSGDISEFVENNTFYISDEEFLDPEYALVIVADDQNQQVISTVTSEDAVTVRGVVRPFVIVDLENEIGFDLDDTLYADFDVEDSAVIIALEVIPFVE